jgi:hypothetical protein
MPTRKNVIRASVMAAALLLAQAAPALAAAWVPGHYNGNGYWIPGHWIGGYGPAPGPYEGPPGPPPYGHHWVGGYYGPQGYWHPGHWMPD